MKAFATGLLVLATVMFVIAFHWQKSGAPGWVGYWASASEAAMVGALADWFAVTALFRRPLGLPIPHTAIIPTRKDQIGASLQSFVADNFLSEAVVRERIAGVEAPRRLAQWVSQPAHAERVLAEAVTGLGAGLQVIGDEDVQSLLEQTLFRRVIDTPWGPPAGRALQEVIENGRHHALVDLVVAKGHDWVLVNEALVERLVSDRAPTWSPPSVDRRVALAVHRQIVRFLAEMRDDPQHPARAGLDRLLAEFAEELRTDPERQKAVEEWKQRQLADPQVRALFTSAAGALRVALLETAQDPDSELRRRAAMALVSLGERIQSDDLLRAKLDGWLGDAVSHVVVTYRDEVATVISETVARWDAQETSRRIELQVGRDLQFIRINGTVVGALAGLAIHAVSVTLL
jgi:uncharacterized membrane-anchored protein YjiN (DUF445 family)